MCIGILRFDPDCQVWLIKKGSVAGGKNCTWLDQLKRLRSTLSQLTFSV